MQQRLVHCGFFSNFNLIEQLSKSDQSQLNMSKIRNYQLYETALKRKKLLQIQYGGNASCQKKVQKFITSPFLSLKQY